MPGARIKGHKLNNSAAALDKQMGRHLKIGDSRKIRVSLAIEAIAKEILHIAATKFTRRQADVMNDQQADVGPLGTLIKIGRRTDYGIAQPAVNYGFTHKNS